MNRRILVIENVGKELRVSHIPDSMSVVISLTDKTGKKISVELYGVDVEVLANELTELSKDCPF